MDELSKLRESNLRIGRSWKCSYREIGLVSSLALDVPKSHLGEEGTNVLKNSKLEWEGRKLACSNTIKTKAKQEEHRRQVKKGNKIEKLRE